MSRLLAINSSPLILLGKLARLDLLPALADQVVVLEAVLSQPGLDIGEPPIPENVKRWNLGAGNLPHEVTGTSELAK